MIIAYKNPATVSLQVIAQKPDGTPKLDVSSGTVRVYHISAAGAEVVDLAPTALVCALSIWRYMWQPASLAEGQYYAEYTLTDGTLTTIVSEDLDVRDVATAMAIAALPTDADVQAASAAALAAYDAATRIDVSTSEGVMTAAIGALNDVSAGDVQSAASAALTAYDSATGTDISTSESAIISHGDSNWGASGGITAQEVRDAMKLAPTAGAPAAGSIDDHLDDMPADVDTKLTTEHGSGDWNGGGGSSLTAQEVRDAMKLAPSSGRPSGGSVDKHLDDIISRANAGGVFGTAIRTDDEKVYVGDVGKDFYFDCVVDISTASKLEVHYTKPGGGTGEWTGTLFGTHEILYSTVLDDIDESGPWKLQPYYELSDGTKCHGATATVTVYDEFE